MSQPKRIVYCYCAYSEVVPRAVRDEVLGKLAASGAEVETWPDLCELAARRDPALQRIAEGGPVQIVACYPRAVRALFAAGGAPLPEEGVEILNMKEQEGEAIARALLGEAAGPRAAGPRAASLDGEAALGPAREAILARKGGWIPWFPVIDAARCEACRQCLNFCLFGVYALSDDGKVRVANPSKCKTYCPACSRICPQVAIIFPKYKGRPINGAEVTEADEQREKVQVDVSKLVRGDVYATLRERGRKRFPTERDEGLALEERQKCARLAELQEKLDIPPEVLKSLRKSECPEEPAERQDGE